MGFLTYGVVVGLLSYWWWHISDNLFLLNIPVELLGYKVYDISIRFLGDPFSPQAHYTIPWVLRIPQVFVPISVLFWAMIGLVIQTVRRRLEMVGKGVPATPWRQRMFKTEKADRFLFAVINIITFGAIFIAAWDFSVLQQGVYRFGWLSLVGFVLFAPGLVIYLVARLTLGRLFSKMLIIVEGHELVTHGIYRHVRHPSYTGSILFWLGLPLVFNSLLGFVVMLPLIILILLRIPVEEAMLIREFGEEYREYMKRTKKLIPFVY